MKQYKGKVTKLTEWLGTPASIIIHTVFFVAIFASAFAGWNVNQMLLVLTTALSIEAIYLALFIQMTVNRASESIEDVSEDIDELEKDIDILQASGKDDDLSEKEVSLTLKTIEKRIMRLQQDLKVLKKKGLM